MSAQVLSLNPHFSGRNPPLLEHAAQLLSFITHGSVNDATKRRLAGAGLRNAYGDAGFAVWDAWCANATDYLGTDICRAEWNQLPQKHSNGNPITLNWLINEAKFRSDDGSLPVRVLELLAGGREAYRREIAVTAPSMERAIYGPQHISPAHVRPHTYAPAAPQAAAPAPQPAKRQAPINWSSFEGREPPARKWVVPHWIPDEHLTLVAGGGGVGKSLLAQHIATSVALGKTYIEPTAPRAVLFWAGEDDESELWRRQRPICEFFGASLSDLAGKLHLHSYAGQDITLMSPVYGQLQPTSLLDELRRQVHDYGARFVILDNIARLFGGNENDRHAVTTFCALVQGACAPAAVLLIGHPAKAAQSEFSGSTAWEGAVRARLFMGYRPPDDTEGEIDPRVRYLARRKANYGELGLRRFTMHDGLLLPSAIDPNPLAADTEALDTVLKAVTKLKEMGKHGAEGQRSDNYLPKLAKGYGLLGKVSEKAFAAAMRRGVADRALVEVQVGVYSNGTARYGLALPAPPNDAVHK